MKTKIALIISLLPVYAFSNASLEQRVADLESKVDALEKIVLHSSATRAESPDVKMIINEKNALLTLTSWSYTLRKERISDYYQIYYTLKNNYTQQIKLIDGSIRFTDLLGEQVYAIKIAPDVRIEAKGELIQSGTFGINQFIPGQTRMGKMQKDDIVATLNIQRIVFADNTILEF
jgi:hypothetical protein